ncbi:MAG: dTMP kinase [Desulfobacterales bacterium]
MQNDKRALFITLEGIEGSGKSTLMKRMVDYFTREGRTCITTREPGGTAIGRKIRSILLDAENHQMDPMTELLLYMADRAQHVREIISPALKSGKTVVCDRFFDATLAYQGHARGLDMNLIAALHHVILEDRKPDITFLLDLPPKIGLERAWHAVHSGDRPDGETRFEKEKIDFHQCVREGYLTLSAAEPRRFRIIDASQNEDGVWNEILKVLATCTCQY